MYLKNMARVPLSRILIGRHHSVSCWELVTSGQIFRQSIIEMIVWKNV